MGEWSWRRDLDSECVPKLEWPWRLRHCGRVAVGGEREKEIGGLRGSISQTQHSGHFGCGNHPAHCRVSAASWPPPFLLCAKSSPQVMTTKVVHFLCPGINSSLVGSHCSQGCGLSARQWPGRGWEVGAGRPLGDGSEGISFYVFYFLWSNLLWEQLAGVRFWMCCI